eukprot:11213195-Lingulodinium_polyedra.AAC.1
MFSQSPEDQFYFWVGKLYPPTCPVKGVAVSKVIARAALGHFHVIPACSVRCPSFFRERGPRPSPGHPD